MIKTLRAKGADLQRVAGLLTVIVVPLSIYWLTAYPSITWWKGASYSLAASVLGVAFPPGSLLLTLVGYPVSRLAFGMESALALNLFSGVLATLCLVLTYNVVLRLHGLLSHQPCGLRTPWSVKAGALIGCLLLGFSPTMWRYAVQFTPYMMTALFTGAILLGMTKWWIEAETTRGWRYLFLVFLLFGLDFSVHRTNLLLLPVLPFWLLLRFPRCLIQMKTWLAGIAGLGLGLSFHLLLIPLARANPILNAGNPDSWVRFWDYVSLKQYGGSWLVNLYPRKAPFWDVQLADYLQMLRANFSQIDGPLALVGVLPGILALIGLIYLWRLNRRYCCGLIISFLLVSVGAVVYFNTPDEYLWPMERHYLPSFVILAVFVGSGATWLIHTVWSKSRFGHGLSKIGLILVLLIIVGNQLARSYSDEDRSESHFAHDCATNVLETLEPDAILFIDDDSFWPISYMQVVEEVRPDVTVIVPSLLNTIWYVEQLIHNNPHLPLQVDSSEYDGFPMKAWEVVDLTIPVLAPANSYGLDEGMDFPDTCLLRVEPQLAGRFLLAQDWLLVKLLQENEWRRPLYFNNPPGWLEKYARNEGLVSRLVPMDSGIVRVTELANNLLQRYEYRGYANPSVPLNKFSKLIGTRYLHSFIELGRAYVSDGTGLKCDEIRDSLLSWLPIDRLDPPEEIRVMIDGLCSGNLAQDRPGTVPDTEP